MMLLALSQEEFQVSERTVELAIDLVEYELHIRKHYDPIDADNNVARMEINVRRILSANPGQWYKWRYLQQRTHSTRVGNWFLKTALDNLCQSGEVERNGAKRAWRWVQADDDV
jgi:hypothetical protein